MDFVCGLSLVVDQRPAFLGPLENASDQILGFDLANLIDLFGENGRTITDRAIADDLNDAFCNVV